MTKLIKNNLFEIIFLIILGLMFREIIPTWIEEWSNFDSFYASGFFILGFIFYLIQKNSDKLAQIQKKPSSIGIFVLILGLISYILGLRGDYTYFTNLSFVFFLVGGCISLLGKRFTMALSFPLVLLASAIPIFPLHRITMPFQLLSAKTTSFILNTLGLHSINEGNNIILEGHVISVVAGCSGLKSLYSLFFITLIYAYFIDTDLWKKISFVIASIPLAITMNVLRILSVSFFVLYNGAEHSHDFHDTAGLVVYVVSIGVIIYAAKLLEKKEESVS